MLADTLQGPRCSIRTRNMYSDANPDYVKMTLLNLPAALVVRPPPLRHSEEAHLLLQAFCCYNQSTQQSALMTSPQSPSVDVQACS